MLRNRARFSAVVHHRLYLHLSSKHPRPTCSLFWYQVKRGSRRIAGSIMPPFALARSASAGVAEFAVKTFDEAILPRMTKRNEAGADVLVVQPLLDGDGRKLAAVIRTQELGATVVLHGALQHGEHIAGSNRRRDMNRQTFTRELIQDAQGFEESSIRQAIKQDVVSPDVITMRGLMGRSSRRTDRGQRARAGCTANPCCFHRRQARLNDSCARTATRRHRTVPTQWVQV